MRTGRSAVRRRLLGGGGGGGGGGRWALTPTNALKQDIALLHGRLRGILSGKSARGGRLSRGNGSRVRLRLGRSSMNSSRLSPPWSEGTFSCSVWIAAHRPEVVRAISVAGQ